MYGITTLLDKNINTFAHTHLIIKILNQMHYTLWVYPCCALITTCTWLGWASLVVYWSHSWAVCWVQNMSIIDSIVEIIKEFGQWQLWSDRDVLFAISLCGETGLCIIGWQLLFYPPPSYLSVHVMASFRGTCAWILLNILYVLKIEDFVLTNFLELQPKNKLSKNSVLILLNLLIF